MPQQNVCVHLSLTPAPWRAGDWCPDCVRSTPAVRAAAAGAALLEVDVGSSAEWKDRSHPLRQDPQLKLTGIPTLFSWTATGPGERLGERAGAEAGKRFHRR